MQDDAPRVNAVVDAAVQARSTTPLLLREVVSSVADVAAMVHACLLRGNRLVFFGNGGSATQAQHFAAELVGRLRRERMPAAAMALTADTAIITAIANDYGFEEVFARQVRALGRAGDVAVAISTSGKSQNVLRAVAAARDVGMHVVALTGAAPNPVADDADLTVAVPSTDTALVQEAHLAIGHIICEVVDEFLAAEPTTRGGSGD